MFKVINTANQETVSFATKKEIASFIAEQGVTTNSLRTIEKKVAGSVKTGEVIYDSFKIEEVVEMVEETVANSAVNEDEVVYDSPETLSSHIGEDVKEEETVEQLDLLEVIKEETEEVEQTEEPAETEETVEEIETVDEVVEEIEETPAVPVIEMFEEIKKENDEKEKEQSEKTNKRKNGKTLICYKNGEEFERFTSIKAAATFMKDLRDLKHMPFTPIMKSAREGIDWDEYSFSFENPEDLHIPKSKQIKEKNQAEENEKSGALVKIDEDIEEIVEVEEETI